MIKNKIIAIITCGTLVIAGIADGTLISNKNMNKKIIQNNILLVAPNLNNLAVVINADTNPLVLYSSPNSNSNIESYISVGEMLNYTPTNNPNFYKVTVQETGASGYISSNNMQIVESGLNKAYKNINKNGQVINVTNNVKLMSTPDVHSQILGSYKNNTQITILGKQDQWYKVSIDGIIGYIYQEYVGVDIIQPKINTSKVSSSSNIQTTSKTTINNSNINNNSNDIAKNHATNNENNISNITPNQVVSNLDIQKGKYSNLIFTKSLKLAVGSKTLNQMIFNDLNSSIKNKYNNTYNNLTSQQENIISNGTATQKENLLKTLGNRLIIISGYNNLPEINNTKINPSNYTNHTFYYAFNITTLKNLCLDIHSTPQNCGLISSTGQIIQYSILKNLIENNEVYTITNGLAAYPEDSTEFSFNNN